MIEALKNTTLLVKSVTKYDFLWFWKKIYAHQGCIYLTKNAVYKL